VAGLLTTMELDISGEMPLAVDENFLGVLPLPIGCTNRIVKLHSKSVTHARRYVDQIDSEKVYTRQPAPPDDIGCSGLEFMAESYREHNNR
jgi:hypothetical protein